jgi:hypothetical protein
MPKIDIDQHVASVIEPIEFVLGGTTYTVPNNLTERKMARIREAESAMRTDVDNADPHELATLIGMVMDVDPEEFADVSVMHLQLTWVWLFTEIMEQMARPLDVVKKRLESLQLSRKPTPASSDTKT